MAKKTCSQELDLGETFRHFNSLMWQIPSWGIAIATAVVLAANEIGKTPSDNWHIAIPHLQAIVLFFGVMLLASLTVLHHRFRSYEAASAPKPLPVPPFRQSPSAESWMQRALCLTTAGLLWLTVVQICPKAKTLYCLVIFAYLGVASCEILLKKHKSVEKEIERQRNGGRDDG